MWARPGSSRDRLEWDRWRGRWTVCCRAPAIGGAANRAIVRMLAGQLGVPPEAVQVLAGEGARAKRIEVAGLDDSEIARRLRSMGPS